MAIYKKNYSELMSLSTYEDRVRYLMTHNSVGLDTFGYDRVFNQMFYNSNEWKQCRRDIILRDNGCDLGLEGYELGQYQFPVIHHINPITIKDIEHQTSLMLDPENLILCTRKTHNIIHYGNESDLTLITPTIRTPNDTCPWKG